MKKIKNPLVVIITVSLIIIGLAIEFLYPTLLLRRKHLLRRRRSSQLYGQSMLAGIHGRMLTLRASWTNGLPSMALRLSWSGWTTCLPSKLSPHPQLMPA